MQLTVLYQLPTPNFIDIWFWMVIQFFRCKKVNINRLTVSFLASVVFGDSIIIINPNVNIKNVPT